MCKHLALIYNKHYLCQSDNFIPTNERNVMVHTLMDACKLPDKLDLIIPKQATINQLLWFHSKDYIEFLKKDIEQIEDDDDEMREFGFGYDCPLKAGLYEYCLEIAGGSITAASLLSDKKYRIVLHWLGGWHHAKRSEAAGYCFVNDCVLAILQLRQVFSKVLYVDLDLHHGDGVQDAFYGTDKVLTFSVHKFECGFFPGTGSIVETGYGKGKGYTVNLPLHDGVKDELFTLACCEVLAKIKDTFLPEAVVCQVGVDGLNGDPMRSFNLTSFSFETCINTIVSWGLPTLLLGGGGYCEANVARCWTKVTASLLDEHLPDDIPEHEYFTKYGPDYGFNIECSFKKDLNSRKYLNEVVSQICSNLDNLSQQSKDVID